MKKVLAMILSLAMVLSLAACGGNDASSDAATDDTAAEESTGEVITLRASSSTAPTHPYNVGLE